MSCLDERTPEDDETSLIRVGDRLPAFRVRLMDGTWLSADSLMGCRSVVVLFNTGCRDCQQELPIVDSLFRDHDDEPDVRFVAIAREEEAETIWDFWDAHDMALPFAAQADRSIYNLFATSVIPRIYLSGSDGVVRYMHTDRDMPYRRQLEEEFGTLK